MKISHQAAAVSAILAALVSTSPAFAQASPGQIEQVKARFSAADKDHDGKLTREEAKVGMPKVARNFDKIDTEHNGYITLEQLAAFIRKQRGG